MKVIDAHTHLGKPGHAIDARAKALIESMDTAGIEKSLVFAGRLNGITTQEVIDEIQPYKDRLFAIASVSEGMTPQLSELESWFRTKQIRGIKFYPGYEYFYPADPWLRPVLKLAEQYEYPVIFHSGDTFSKVHESKLKFALPIHIDDLAVEMPKLNIVIAHMGYPWQREAAEVAYKNKNVYTDCSGFVYGAFGSKEKTHFREMWDEFVKIAGSHEKIMFGSDWPISNQQSYTQLLTEMPMRDDVREQVMYNTAQKLFKLE